MFLKKFREKCALFMALWNILRIFLEYSEIELWILYIFQNVNLFFSFKKESLFSVVFFKC